MREGAEDAARTIASLLHIVAFGGFVDLGMELLLRASMTVRARVSLLAVARLAPFFAVFHVRAWCRTIFIFPGATSLVLAVVILWTSVTLPTEPRRSLTRLGLVVAQHIVRVLPLWILVHQVAFLIEDVRPVRRGVWIRVWIFQRLDLLDVVHGRTQIMITVREGAMWAILHTKSTCVGVMNAHACFIVA